MLARKESFSPNEIVAPMQKDSKKSDGVVNEEINQGQIRYDSLEL